MRDIAQRLLACSQNDFAVPANGDCTGLLEKPMRVTNLSIDGLFPVAEALRNGEQELAETIAPCEVCGHDTYHDIVVGWVKLFDGEQFVNGFRLCDTCAQQAKKEDSPYIVRLVVVHRVRDTGVVETPNLWERLCATHCGLLNK